MLKHTEDKEKENIFFIIQEWNAYLAKSVEILKVCFVEGIPHNFNVHVIQVLENIHIRGRWMQKTNNTKKTPLTFQTLFLLSVH